MPDNKKTSQTPPQRSDKSSGFESVASILTHSKDLPQVDSQTSAGKAQNGTSIQSSANGHHVMSNREKEEIKKKYAGLVFERYFTKEGMHPYDEIEWEIRDARIEGADGKVVFEQKEVEVPKFWSQQATNIVAQKYFRGRLGTPERERSVKQMVDRVAKTITKWGVRQQYFEDEKSAQVFEEELTYLLVNQYLSFNSPVWFNVGFVENPQCSACFILRVEDDMNSILEWYKKEGQIFKGGSGSGVSVSRIRAEKEPLSRGGYASGPLSFMRGADSIAGAIKSGGTTRRAAKMVIMDISHPDIEDFIWCKAKEEKKAYALGDAGYDLSLNGEAWQSIQFQNANNSVRVTDEFMQAVVDDGDWETKYVGEIWKGKTAKKYKARDLMRQIAQAAWECADPGVQYDTTINKWNPCINSDRIYASNPCSEYMFLDNSACNLASLNLMKFRDENGDFDVEAFEKAVDVLITAQEIIVDNSSYPTEEIAQNSHDYRPLGIGYTNLGALLMSRGLPYDSDEGRNYAAAITSIMSGRAYRQSAIIAEKKGAFKYFDKNREPFLKVLNMHKDAAYNIDQTGVEKKILEEAVKVWEETLSLAKKHGVRNAQISLLAPTGTISFMMDATTTGIEPAIALVSYKYLVGGGMIKLVNTVVPEALERLGYTEEEIKDIMEYIDKHDTIEGAPHLKEEHLPVFDCAFKPANGKRFISPMGHIKMMAAVQPFLSGAISKTVNLPEDATVEDIENIYIEGWKLGLKAIAVYRDGCKKAQPLVTKDKKEKEEGGKGEVEISFSPQRKELPVERKAVVHEFVVAGHKGYLTVGLFEDGSPAEIFISMNKAGSTMAGLMDAFAISISFNLQYGVPLETLVRKFAHVRFEPSGMTNNENIRIAKSIIDYIFRWLALRFLPAPKLAEIGLNNLADIKDEILDLQEQLPLEDIQGVHNGQNSVDDDGIKDKTYKAGDRQQVNQIAGTGISDLTSSFSNTQDAPLCFECGSIMVRNGSCYKCVNCGSTSGCS